MPIFFARLKQNHNHPMKIFIRSSLAAILAILGIATGHAAPEEAGKPSILELMAKVETAANAGNTAEADTLMVNALDLLRKEAGKDHPSVGMALTKQGALRMHSRRFAEAAASSAEATGMLEKSLGRDNPIAFGARYQWLTATRLAGDAAMAADVARHLLDTLTELTTSGRARQAGWDTVGVAPNQRLKLPVTPDEAGIAEVESLLGLCLAEAGKSTEASPVLASSLARIEKLYGQGHPRGVALQQAIEKIALARGEAIGRRHVGDLALTRNLRFEGNNGFTAADIIHGLTTDAGVVLASHPAAAFSAFLDAIQHALQRGYRAAGYPDARVVMRYAAEPTGSSSIIAAVTEGPRFSAGKVMVNGAPAEITDGLIRTLTEVVPQQANTLEQRIDAEITAAQAMMTAEKKENPAEQAASDILAKDSLPAEIQMLSQAASTTAFWQSGEPVDFESLTESAIQTIVQMGLARSGRPMARWNHRIERMPDGKCDLVITIDDPGPLAVVGSLKVTGNRRNTAGKIIGLTKLKPGDPLLPDHLAAVRMALWNTGRFWPFSVKTMAVAGSKDVDVVISVNELEKAPALDAELTDVQAAAMRAVKTINEAFASRGFLLAGEKDGLKLDLAIGKEGLVVAKLARASDGRNVLLGINRGMLRLVSRDKSGTASFALPVGAHGVKGFAKLLPTRNFDKDWHMDLGIGAGMQTSSDNGSATFTLDVLASPAFVFLSNLDLNIKDGLLIASSKGTEQFTTDAATGTLVSIAGYPVTMGDTMTKSLLGELDASIAGAGTTTTSLSWPDVLARGLGTALRDMRPADTGDTRHGSKMTQQISAAAGSFITDWLPFLREFSVPRIDAAERVTARLLGKILADDGKTVPVRTTFYIPADSTMGQNMTVPILLGLGCIQLSENLFPPDTWMATLSRELLFSVAGNHRYTAETMNNLVADPEMGPLGCLLAARIIGMISPGMVRRFEEKALSQCHAAGFRRDWELALRGDSGIAPMITRCFDSMAALTPAEEADILLLLGPGRSTWFKDFLAALRARPAGKSLADCVAPHLDKLWDQDLGPMISKPLDARLHPPVDPLKVAALANGTPVPRSLVDYIQRIGGSPACPGKRRDEHGGNTWKQARQDLIRLILVREEYLANGGSIDPAAVEKIFLGQLPQNLVNADDATLQKSCGLTREEARFYVELRAVLETAGSPKLRAVQTPDAAEIAQWQAGPGAGLFDEYHVHSMKTSGPDASPFNGQFMAVGRLHALRALHAHGIPEAILAMACRIDRGGLVDFQCQKALPNYGMHPALGIAMTAIKPGGISQPVQAGGKSYLLLPVSQKPGSPPAGNNAAPIIVARAAFAKQEQMIESWLQGLEKHAEVTLIDGPEPDDKTWIATSKRTAESWNAEHPGSLIARLIVLWCAVHGNDDASLDRSIADLGREPTFDADAMTKLADAVATAGKESHAKQLRALAATRPKPTRTEE